MSTNLVRRDSTGQEIALPAGARLLGARVKPIIRLGMGFKDPERGFPRKTDYFTIRGDERAIAKFKKVYGEQPKAVKIMVPSELSLALDISYRAFVGGQSEDGGRPLALGNTNFAPLGYAGGRDVLKVWRGDGTFEEVETLGLDVIGKPLDAVAQELGIELYTTFTFTIPEVLGWGSFAQITSKGKKTADNLAFKLTEIYAAFGSRAPWAFDREQPPMLVIKPDTALTRFEDKQTGEGNWGKSKIFVLDIVIPEAFHDMQDRLLEHQARLAPAGPVAALYAGGGGSSSDSPSVMTPGPDQEQLDDRQQAVPPAGSSQTSAPVDGTVPGDEDEPLVGEVVDEDEPQVLDDAVVELGRAAAAYLVPDGKEVKGLSLGEIFELVWALEKKQRPDGFQEQIRNFCRVYLPDAFAKVEGQS